MTEDSQKAENVLYIREFLALRRINKVQYSRRSMVIKARAVVDIVEAPPPHGKGLGTFDVEVWGVDPGEDYVRRYRIQAKSDTMAAREGLERFCDEIGKLLAREGEK